MCATYRALSQMKQPFVSEIADTIKISKKYIGRIFYEYLGMRKLCTKWVPRGFTIKTMYRDFN